MKPPATCHLPRPTVFIVDNDPAVLKGLSRLLRSARLKTITFSSPREFLDQYDSDTTGCVVLDVRLVGWAGVGRSKH